MEIRKQISEITHVNPTAIIAMHAVKMHPDRDVLHEAINLVEDRAVLDSGSLSLTLRQGYLYTCRRRKVANGLCIHMQDASFNLQHGELNSQAKHMDYAVYNTINAEEAKLIAEMDEEDENFRYRC